MTENERVCRRCLLLQSGKGDVLRDIRERIEKIPQNEKASAEIYGIRLAVCEKCEFLTDGTCLKCGCYPEFRGAFIKNRCPAGRW